MFPTPEEQARAQVLENNYKLFEGKFNEVLDYFKTANDRRNKLEVNVNMCEMISTIFADLLFLEEPTITVSEDSGAEQGKLDAIIDNNNFFSQLWESAIAQSWGGKAVFEVRLANGLAVIEESPPDIVFPQYNQRNIKAKPDQIIFAWYVEISKKPYLFKKIHSIGRIDYQLWECDAKKGKPKTIVPLAMFDATLPEEGEETGLDLIPVFWANNPKDGKKPEGVSDYKNLYSLLSELCRVNSQIATQLKKHGDAKLAVPPGVLDEKGEVALERLEMIEVETTESGGFQKPEYISNANSLIDQAFKQRDEIKQEIARISEVAFVLLDLPVQGGVMKDETFSESAARTIAKVKRKKKTYTNLIQEVLAFAYFWEHNKRIPKSAINVKFHDSLPENAMRKTNIEVARMTVGIQSKRDAIKNLDGLSGEALEAKLEEIKAEENSLVKVGF